MTEQNPYQAPDANLTEGIRSSEVELAITGIKSLPAMAGLDWIKDAFSLFMRKPLMWIVLVVLWFVLNIVMQIIPVIGWLAASLLYAVFLAGFMLGCAALEQGDDLEIGHLFAGFKNNTGSLIGLGAVYLGVGILFVLIFGAMMFMFMGGANVFANPESMNVGALVLPVLIGLLLTIPVMMMFWFAPVLISLGNVPLFEALKMSFNGCLKNIVPLFVFSIIMMVLAVIATIPFGLGWIVFMPVGMAAFYTAYRAIYTD